ncbi:hypothetical protein [Gorillibacterium timonense]|uniref:hypothetical protein n=1 Tax=Gorillibacterium timonense TaxID=1689269 RepID=UPI0011DD4699|nr:hypothetical protein [Gorillibacterium timonense]
MLLTNFVGIKITAGIGSLHGSVFLHMKFIPILAIHFFSFVVGGYLSSKLNDAKTWFQMICLGVGIGILYSLFLAVMSIIGGGTSSIPIPFIRSEMYISSKFSHLEAINHGFLFGSLFSILGAWIQKEREK